MAKQFQTGIVFEAVVWRKMSVINLNVAFSYYSYLIQSTLTKTKSNKNSIQFLYSISRIYKNKAEIYFYPKRSIKILTIMVLKYSSRLGHKNKYFHNKHIFGFSYIVCMFRRLNFGSIFFFWIKKLFYFKLFTDTTNPGEQRKN